MSPAGEAACRAPRHWVRFARPRTPLHPFPVVTALDESDASSRCDGGGERSNSMRLRISYAGVMAATAAISCALVGSAGARPLDNGEAAISGVTPKQAMVGQLVTISGMNLDV